MHGRALAILTLLFALRVLGQALVVFFSVTWLPPSNWLLGCAGPASLLADLIVLARYPMNNRASMRLWTHLKRHMIDRWRKRNPPRSLQSGPIRRVDITPDGAKKIFPSVGYHERTASVIP